MRQATGGLMETRMRMSISSLFMALLAAAIPAYALDIGDVAPNFTAESTRGKVSLSDYRGKSHVVLAFYYADFTPV